MTKILTCIVALTLLVAGCSEDVSRVTDPLIDGTVNQTDNVAPAMSVVQLVAQVKTIDQNQRMITFEGLPDTVIALRNCAIVRLQNDNESPIPFVNVGPGDSILVNGTRMQDGYVHAHQIQVCSGGCDGLCYDVAFRDTILAIDYGSETFTVANRTETITTDSFTLIWATVTRYYSGPDQMRQHGTCEDATGEGPGNDGVMRRDTILTFTDLEVGDIVEVRASVIDSTSLLAGKIKLVACNDVQQRCIEFSDYLASVDSQSGLVTFDNNSWLGMVCPSARLIGIDGLPLSLDEFSAGDFVDVKGFPLESDTLKVCQLVQAMP